jgi:VWFA-related protein
MVSRRKFLSLLLIFCILGLVQPLFGQQIVNMYVTVMNNQGQVIKGMKAINFKIFENDNPREIKFFSSEGEPASIALVFDLSASVTHNETDNSKNRITWFRRGAIDFIQLLRPDNEYTLLSFAENIKPLADFTDRQTAVKMIQDDSNFVRPKKDGATPLFVAMKAAMDKLATSKLSRRVLVVMTDGFDNTLDKQVKSDFESAVQSSLIPVYLVLAFDPTASNPGMALNFPDQRLESIAINSGGGSYGGLSEALVRNGLMKIATIVENQYHMGFIPEQSMQLNKPRKLEVRLEVLKEDEKTFHSPTPYYCRKYIPTL